MSISSRLLGHLGRSDIESASTLFREPTRRCECSVITVSSAHEFAPSISPSSTTTTLDITKIGRLATSEQATPW
jgi:hypothetical protein